MFPEARQLMQPYRWSCLACSTGNAAAAIECSHCRCPARPTFAQISEARNAAGIVEPCEGPSGEELLDLVSNPFRRKSDPSAAYAVTELSLYALLWMALKSCGG